MYPYICFKISSWGFLLTWFSSSYHLSSRKLYPIACFLWFKCAYSFEFAISRAIWQCLHTISGHIFGFHSHLINTALIFVTSAPSNVKIISLKKKSTYLPMLMAAAECQQFWVQLWIYIAAVLYKWKQEHLALWMSISQTVLYSVHPAILYYLHTIFVIRMKTCHFVIALQWTICTLLEIIIFWHKKYFIIEKLMIY